MSLIQELKRRNVIRVGVLYLVAAWLLLQLTDVLSSLLNVPESAGSIVVMLLILGFFPVVIFAWVYELTPDGLKREVDIDRSMSTTDETGKRLNIATISLVVLGIGMLALDRFVTEEGPSEKAAPVQTVVEEAGVSTVAVLPFTATGSEDGGLLAGGLHDDLLTRLAKLRAFKVISRTSVMEYAETTKNMRQIGEELGARYILEGGVQAVGDRVRINAQLIDAETDEHVWAHTFNNEMTAANLFDVQAELAKAIAGEMKATLSASDSDLIEDVPTQNIEAYSAFLRGLDLRERGGHNEENVALVTAAFEQAVSLDPGFARAWAQLSIERSRRAQGTKDPVLEQSARVALQTARELQPELYDADLANVVYLYRVEYEYDSALQELEALGDKTSLGAQDLMLKAFLLRRVGRFDEAYDSALEAKRLDPRSISVAQHLVTLGWQSNQCEAAGAHARAAMALASEIVDIAIAVATYELMCTGNAQRANQLLMGVEFTGSSQMLAARESAMAARDYARVLELDFEVFTTRSPVLKIADDLLRADAMRNLNRYDEAEAKIAAAGEMLAAIHKDGGEGPMIAVVWMLYCSLTGDAEQTQFWVAESKTQLRKLTNDDHAQQAYFMQIYASNLARAGLQDAAIEELQIMLETPGATLFSLVEIWPPFDSLRDHPGYIALANRYSTSDGK